MGPHGGSAAGPVPMAEVLGLQRRRLLEEWPSRPAVLPWRRLPEEEPATAVRPGEEFAAKRPNASCAYRREDVLVSKEKGP
ncbi:hypothetical protein PR202_gb00105 [Eleusine coracana subsp. coracana]|uniref:Uncharacterized protein n=1 Tax=Eleusine coracana subsp. coracana TaxID=191504 RepID=A0AAV5DQS0_ELECO|nr:hypothetical protein PR202_gb00105 [Eleusine coracana subsp. coracana]